MSGAVGLAAVLVVEREDSHDKGDVRMEIAVVGEQSSSETAILLSVLKVGTSEQYHEFKFIDNLKSIDISI